MTDRELRESTRRRMLQWRKALDPATREEASRRITELIAALPAWKSAGTVMLYYPFRGEADITALHGLARGAGKRVLYPRCAEARVLEACAVEDTGALLPGAYGIMEPDAGCSAADPSEIDLAVLPGVAFDARGYRLGYGAGYYDRFLPAMRPDAWTVLAAFAGQEIPRIPERTEEKPLSAIVTQEEAKILRK